MKYRKQIFQFYNLILYLAFLMSAFLLSETIDLTVKSGLNFNKQVVPWLLISLAITIALYLYKSQAKGYIKRNFDV
jgi:uncharacterized membrane protein (GlpM family)